MSSRRETQGGSQRSAQQRHFHLVRIPGPLMPEFRLRSKRLSITGINAASRPEMAGHVLGGISSCGSYMRLGIGEVSFFAK